MKPSTLVVLSRYPDVFEGFRKCAELWERDTPKVLVRDGHEIQDPDEGWQVLQGPEEFRFSRNANLGIAAAGDRDVLLVNDDVRFDGPISQGLADIASLDERVGLVSPQVWGAAKNALQRATTALVHDPTVSRSMIAFVCVYIRRSLISEIGMLDERFTCSYEDDDYYRRACLAGFSTLITRSVVVKHGFAGSGGSVSIHRRFGGYQQILKENHARFLEKWAPQA